MRLIWDRFSTWDHTTHIREKKFRGKSWSRKPMGFGWRAGEEWNMRSRGYIAGNKLSALLRGKPSYQCSISARKGTQSSSLCDSSVKMSYQWWPQSVIGTTLCSPLVCLLHVTHHCKLLDRLSRLHTRPGHSKCSTCDYYIQTTHRTYFTTKLKQR